MKEKPRLSLASAKSRLLLRVQKLGKYKVLLFILFVACVYAYVYLSISNYANQQPSQIQVLSKVKATAAPRIDKTVVDKLQTLRDNSVSVQALFNQARSNPFQ